MHKQATREAYGEALAELMQKRSDIVVLDADLSKSTKTITAKQSCSARHFNMGIAEANMMGVSAGLAASGKVVFASSFAMFAAGRAYEQIRNSIAYPNLNVKICATHAGISVGEDGATHQCMEDLALMRVLPNMSVFQPCDAISTKKIIQLVSEHQGPCYVRLGRLSVEDVYDSQKEFTIGKANILKQGKNLAILSTGLMVQEALHAKELLQKQGINPTIVDFPTIKPLDQEMIIHLAKTHRAFITCEEHSYMGGFGSAVAEVCAMHHPMNITMIAMQDVFGESGKPKELLHKYHLDADAIVAKAKELTSRFT